MAMLMVMLMVNLAKCDAIGDMTNGDAVHINILACIWLKGCQKKRRCVYLQITILSVLSSFFFIKDFINSV